MYTYMYCIFIYKFDAKNIQYAKGYEQGKEPYGLNLEKQN